MCGVGRTTASQKFSVISAADKDGVAGYMAQLVVSDNGSQAPAGTPFFVRSSCTFATREEAIQYTQEQARSKRPRRTASRGKP